MSRRSSFLFCELLLATGLTLVASSMANPIPAPPLTYIAAEKLEVVAGVDAAEIKGVFQFRSDASKGSVSDMGIEIPVWIPAKGQHGDATVRRFLNAYPSEGYYKFESVDRTVWDAAIGLRFRVGKKDVPLSWFRIFQPKVDSPWYRKGWSCVVVMVYVPADLLAARIFRGVPDCTITYRQPLLKGSGSSEFFYVPMFDHLPEGASTVSVKRYAAHLKNGAGSVLRFGSTSLGSGESLLLPLVHRQPIVFHVSRN
jgi:hypothetical protein